MIVLRLSPLPLGGRERIVYDPQGKRYAHNRRFCLCLGAPLYQGGALMAAQSDLIMMWASHLTALSRFRILDS